MTPPEIIIFTGTTVLTILLCVFFSYIAVNLFKNRPQANTTHILTRPVGKRVVYKEKIPESPITIPLQQKELPLAKAE